MFRGFSQILAMHKAAIAATHRFDYVLSPTAPMTAFPAEWASPSRDPLNPFPHIGFTVAFNMSEQPAVVGQLRLRRRGPADRPADRRAAVRRPRRAVGRPRLRGDPLGRDAAVAGAAGDLSCKKGLVAPSQGDWRRGVVNLFGKEGNERGEKGNLALFMRLSPPPRPGLPAARNTSRSRRCDHLPSSNSFRCRLSR